MLRRHRNDWSIGLGYTKPTPGSDPTQWDAIDRQDVSGWTPEILTAKINAAQNLDELDHLLFSLQYARDVTYNHDGNEARDNRIRVTGLMDLVLAKRMQWLQNKEALAMSASEQLGWYANPALVPPENYTGKSNDPTVYGQNLVQHYGGLNQDDMIRRMADVNRAKAKAADDAARARAAASLAATQAAHAVAAAQANPTPENAQVATAAQLAAQTAQHDAQSAQTAAASVTGESGAGGLLKLAGIALTVLSFAR